MRPSRSIANFYFNCMVKKLFLLLGSTLYVSSAMAQYCATDDINRGYEAQHPGIKMVNAQLEAEIQAQLKKIDPNKVGLKGTDNTDTVTMDIPVVVHVVHDYGSEYVSDDNIYTMIRELNELYNKQNATLSSVIPTFVPYIGNGHIKFHLATKDPQGNPTHGITRRRSYLTEGGDDQAKFDLWSPSSYLNIWFINKIGLGTSGTGIVAAYSMVPATAQYVPYYDGLISNYQFINNTTSSSHTVGHEIGHYLNLNHPWGQNNSPGVACGDDGVTDTPPTKGHFSTCNLYDTECAIGNPDGPDTTNVQNVMDYSNCVSMFTQGQVDRARAALRSNTANRSNLWSASNLAATGALAARPAMAPIADFSVTRPFFCPTTTAIGITFSNRSWNDTITSVSWTFSNGALASTSNNNTVSNGFSQSGWVTATLKATSAHGSDSITKKILYIADPNAVPGGTIEDFNPGSANVDKFPVFDYYNTGRKWELTTSAGFYDNTSMRYVNKDSRTSSDNSDKTGSPRGDYSDFFTVGYDLSQFTTSCYVNFVYSGASRSNTKNDALEISYSSNCGLSWIQFDSLVGSELANRGVVTADYTPSGTSDWKFRAFNVPSAARTSKTYFRFRYKPGTDNSNAKMGTGNNFYLDRLTVGNSSTDVNSVALETTGMEVAPNPTSGNAYVLLKNAGNGMANMMITDITGKVVYNTQQKLDGSNIARLEIPASGIYAKGIYMVRVIADSKTYTRKLVVN